MEAWARRRKTAQALAQRSRIVLVCSEGLSSSEVARRLSLTVGTVRKWRTRFVAAAGRAARRASPGPAPHDQRRPRSKGSSPPPWSRRRKTRRIGRPVPWRPSWGCRSRRCRGSGGRSGCSRTAETFKLSTDPLFVDKVRDVVGLYLDPPERAVVLCVDEKSQIQALDRTAPILPMLPGTPSAAPTTTSGPAPPACSRRWTSPPAMSSAAAPPTPRHRVQEAPATIDTRCRPTSTSISCSTTPPPTRHRRSTLAGRATHASSALHPDQRLVAQPRRAVVRRTHHQEAPPRHPPHRPRPRTPTSAPGSPPGTTTPTLRVDQDRRPDPRLHRPLLHTNQRLRTLARRAD